MRLITAGAGVLLALAAIITLPPTRDVPRADAAEHEVTVADFSFSPGTLNIVAGDTVNWTLADGTHTVVADDGSFSSAILDASGFSRTFTTPGTYEYYCSVHSSPELDLMNGVINVAAPQTPPTNTPQPQPTNTPQQPTATPDIDATDTPVASPTAGPGAGSPTPVEAVAIAAPADDVDAGGASGGRTALPATGAGTLARGSTLPAVVLLMVAGIGLVAAAAGGCVATMRRRR